MKHKYQIEFCTEWGRMHTFCQTATSLEEAMRFYAERKCPITKKPRFDLVELIASVGNKWARFVVTKDLRQFVVYVFLISALPNAENEIKSNFSRWGFLDLPLGLIITGDDLSYLYLNSGLTPVSLAINNLYFFSDRDSERSYIYDFFATLSPRKHFIIFKHGRFVAFWNIFDINEDDTGISMAQNRVVITTESLA